MKRSGPPKRKTPLRNKTELRPGGLESRSELKRTPIKKRSTERANLMKDERVPLIEKLIDAGFGCEIAPVLAHYDVPGRPKCAGKIDGLHERRKRSAGGSLRNHNNLVPACNRCNGFIEDAAGIVRELTGDALVVREGDPEWESLSRRLDD